MRPKTVQLPNHAVASKDLSWFDRLNIRLESLIDVEPIINSTDFVQQTSQYVETSVSSVSTNMRKLCGDFMRDIFLPPLGLEDGEAGGLEGGITMPGGETTAPCLSSSASTEQILQQAEAVRDPEQQLLAARKQGPDPTTACHAGVQRREKTLNAVRLSKGHQSESSSPSPTRASPREADNASPRRASRSISSPGRRLPQSLGATSPSPARREAARSASAGHIGQEQGRKEEVGTTDGAASGPATGGAARGPNAEGTKEGGAAATADVSTAGGGRLSSSQPLKSRGPVALAVKKLEGSRKVQDRPESDCQFPVVAEESSRKASDPKTSRRTQTTARTATETVTATQTGDHLGALTGASTVTKTENRGGVKPVTETADQAGAVSLTLTAGEKGLGGGPEEQVKGGEEGHMEIRYNKERKEGGRTKEGGERESGGPESSAVIQTVVCGAALMEGAPGHRQVAASPVSAEVPGGSRLLRRPISCTLGSDGELGLGQLSSPAAAHDRCQVSTPGGEQMFSGATSLGQVSRGWQGAEEEVKAVADLELRLGGKDDDDDVADDDLPEIETDPCTPNTSALSREGSNEKVFGSKSPVTVFARSLEASSSEASEDVPEAQAWWYVATDGRAKWHLEGVPSRSASGKASQADAEEADSEWDWELL